MGAFKGRTTISVDGLADAVISELAAQLQIAFESVAADFAQVKEVRVDFEGGRLSVIMKLEADPSSELDEIADQLVARGFAHLAKQQSALHVVESALMPA